MPHAWADLGYNILHDRDAWGQTNHHLDVTIEECPTEQHYDPQTLSLTVVSPRGDHSSSLLVHHPPLSRNSSFRVCPGEVRLEDRKRKIVGFFTYGGELFIYTEDERTRCRLTSTAPIIIRRSGIPGILAEMSLLLMAERRAAHSRQRTNYEERLCQVDPFVLYAAILQELCHRFEKIPYERRWAKTEQFIDYLPRAIRQAEREPNWPRPVPALADVL